MYMSEQGGVDCLVTILRHAQYEKLLYFAARLVHGLCNSAEHNKQAIMNAGNLNYVMFFKVFL